MELFWRQGYEGTSVRDLIDHTGLGQGSLYGAFGDKHALFLRVLDRYRELMHADLLACVGGEGPVRPAVRRLLELLGEQDLADSERRGCLLVNAAMELVPRDPETARRVAAAFDALEDALCAAIARGQVSGELPAERDPRALASFLLTTIQGLRVVGKTTPTSDRLRDSIEGAMVVLG